MIEVIKNDGTRQPFSERKLRVSIEKAAKEAKVSEARIKQVVSDAASKPLDWSKGRTAIETRAIRETILDRLDAIEPKVSEAWRGFDKTKRAA
jgi:transcriptional regulator NrdR family protein